MHAGGLPWQSLSSVHVAGHGPVVSGAVPEQHHHPPGCRQQHAEPTFVGPTYVNATKVYPTAADHVNGAIKCQQISGGDGYATMGDGTQTYLFSFGPLSGLADMATGKPGTQFPSVFNTTTPVRSWCPVTPPRPTT